MSERNGERGSLQSGWRRGSESTRRPRINCPKKSQAKAALAPLRRRPLRRFPCPVFCGHAHGARPIACSFRPTFIAEEYAVLHVATAGDRLVRCTAGETPVRTLPTMTSEKTWYFTLVGLAVCIQQRPGLLRHRASRNSSSTWQGMATAK